MLHCVNADRIGNAVQRAHAIRPGMAGLCRHKYDTKVFAVAVEARAFSTQTWRRKPQVGHQDIVRLMAPSGGERAVPALKTIR